MAKPNISKKRRRRPVAAPPASRRRPGSRARPLLIGAAVIVVAAVVVILAMQRHSAPQVPERAPAVAFEPEASIVLTGLTAKQQVEVLNEATLRLTQNLVAQFPEEAEARVLLGDTHRALGQSSKALACWGQALQKDSNRPDVHDRMATVAMEKGQFEDASAHWARVLALNPRAPGVRANLARVQMALGRQEEAIAALKDEVKLSPRSVSSFCLLGQACLQTNQYAEAIEHYTKAVALDPNVSNAYYGLATAFARLKRTAEARDCQAKFRELTQRTHEDRPYGHTAVDDLANAKETFVALSMQAASLQQAAGQSRAAEALLKQAMGVDPKHVDCRRKLAAAYRSAGRLPQALEQCEQIAQLDPSDPMCQFLIGSLAIQLKQFGRAEAAFRKITALAPRESLGYRELATLYLAAGQKLAEARKLAERAVALEPAAPNYVLLGRVCFQTGDTTAARDAVRRAVQMDPRNTEYRRIYNLIEERR